MAESGDGKIGRREFVTGTAAAAGWMIIDPKLVRGTAANSAVRLGLLGCGGRGTHDATSIATHTGTRVVALGDLFDDQLQKAKTHFDQVAQKQGYSSVDRSLMFRGPNAYEQIMESKEIDAVVVTTPPYFHVQHLEAAVAAGKHVYCEKPVSVDVHGTRRVLEAGRKAEGRLSLEVGFQIRHAPPFVALAERIHNGAIGDIACGEAYYYTSAIERPAWPNASPVERRLRNWVYDRVLSGDIIVEQNIHVIDVCNWYLQARPVKAVATGGRAARTDSGNAWGHYNVVFTYPGEVHVTLNSTQFDKGWWDVNERFFGSKGVAESHYSGPIAIYGEQPWNYNTAQDKQTAEPKSFSVTGAFLDNLADADAEKHKAFINSITSGKFHNQAALGVESALTAMLGRTAAYLGRELTWDELVSMDMQWDSGIDLKQFA